MTDVHSKQIRSYNMSMIKSKNTTPEIMVRKYLFHHGFRYRLNVKNLPGKPDIVLPKYRTVIFVNGCFWHGHKNCSGFVLPKSNTEWWERKINNTKVRDEKVYQLLRDSGWKVFVIWACQLRKNIREENLSQLAELIKE